MFFLSYNVRLENYCNEKKSEGIDLSESIQFYKIYNNIGNVYVSQKKFESAKEYYDMG